jgi:hypothetical protein
MATTITINGSVTLDESLGLLDLARPRQAKTTTTATSRSARCRLG